MLKSELRVHLALQSIKTELAEKAFHLISIIKIIIFL